MADPERKEKNRFFSLLRNQTKRWVVTKNAQAFVAYKQGTDTFGFSE